MILLLHINFKTLGTIFEMAKIMKNHYKFLKRQQQQNNENDEDMKDDQVQDDDELEVEEPPLKKLKTNEGLSMVTNLGQTSNRQRKEPKKKGNFKNGEEELQAYLALKLIFDKQDAQRITKDPGIWWAEHWLEFPYVSVLYRAIMCIPGSSCSTEAMFSIAKHLVEGSKFV